jgi:hypothetical protein
MAQRPRPAPAVTLTLPLAGAVAIAAIIGACARPVERAGRGGDVLIESYGSRLEAKLPPDVSPLTARAAAERTLRERGYVITDSYGTEDRFRIEAAGAGERRGERTAVEGWLIPGGSRLRVESGLFGDETAARSLLDGVLAAMGR